MNEEQRFACCSVDFHLAVQAIGLFLESADVIEVNLVEARPFVIISAQARIFTQGIAGQAP